MLLFFGLALLPAAVALPVGEWLSLSLVPPLLTPLTGLGGGVWFESQLLPGLTL